ncbi:MAG: sulfotransferase [Rhodobacterales bacterium]|nr:sulfotransferase [Rhodobacterales bacterium]
MASLPHPADSDPDLAPVLALHKAGRLVKADKAYGALVAARPDLARAWHLWGLLAIQKGQPAEAEPRLRRALDLDPDSARAWTDLGSALALSGRVHEAQAAFERAATLDPATPDPLYNMGRFLHEAGRSREAEAAYGRALAVDPAHADANSNLAVLLMARDDLHGAEPLLRAALAAHPGHGPAQWNLASCLERLNRIDEAHAVATALADAAPADHKAALIAGRLARRIGDFAGAEARLRTLETAKAPGLRQNALFELGLVLDRLDRPEVAFQAFQAGNTLQAALGRSRNIDPAAFRTEVARARQAFTAERLAAWGARPADDALASGPDPVFFVGFPRSGTTLFEQVLAAHPRVVTTDEDSPLARVKAAIQADGLYPDGLADAPDHALGLWRAAFHAGAQDVLGAGDPDRVLVDKLPLNLVDLGLVNRLFPRAKVIVALRDPRDVCLSCFMQQFRLNPAMANFTDLDATARLYSDVMDLWTHYKGALTLPWMEYRYEDLLDDLEGTARKVLAFLDLPWDDGVLAYRDRAADRAISTPSYRDVTDGLYDRARGRWRRYKDQLRPVLPVLARHVVDLGYPAD